MGQNANTAASDTSPVAAFETSLDQLEPCLAGRPEPWDWDAFAEAQDHYAGIGLAPPVGAS